MTAPPASQSRTQKGHIPALDGMRGLAVLLVLLCHVTDRFQCNGAVWRFIRDIAYSGWTGVDLFFVLSGFLITGILWETREAPHYFLNFYMRRTLRIFPLYYGALILFLFIVPAAAPLLIHIPQHIRPIVESQVTWLTAARPYWPFFYSNFVDVLVVLKGLTVYVTHFWSLSVEEHFYLVWPILVFRLRLRTLMLTSAALVIGALVSRALALPFASPNAIYAFTLFRIDGLALGSLIALLWRIPYRKLQLEAWARAILPVAGLILFAIICYKGRQSPYGRLSQTIGYSASILFYGSLLVTALQPGLTASIFCHRFFRVFGKYSYSIYIFHPLPLFLAAPMFSLGDPNRPSIIDHVLKYFAGRPLPAAGTLLWMDGILFMLFVAAASLGIAFITWHMLEAPCLRLKRFFPYEERRKRVEGEYIVAELVRPG